MSFSNPALSNSPTLHFTISFPKPQTNYVEVMMRVENTRQMATTVKMAVWTPGSYLIREYAKNVESVVATDEKGSVIPHRKISKNQWLVENKGKPFKINYSVYAYELSVRNAYVDHEMAYLNGAAVFMYTDEARDHAGTLTIQKPDIWKHITTALQPVAEKPNLFRFNNIDELFDSPIQIGNHDIFEFTALGIPHTVAMVGEAKYDREKIKNDFKKICEAAAKVVGKVPLKRYTFIVHNLAGGGGGGLEHAHSTTVQTAPQTYENEQNYINFLSLIAHEYFHLWNIKRIRPQGLDRFNYEAENYTHMLWFAEGGTSYYDDFINYRSGIMPEERFFQVTASNIMAAVNTPGNRIQSLAESSLDAWIKYYRQNENSVNSMANYYSKGSAVNLALDLEIIIRTKGKKNLDDVVRLLYERYYEKENRGYTDEEFIAACNEIAGADLSEFFSKHIYGVVEPDYENLLQQVGMTLKDGNAEKNTGWLGANTRVENGKMRITATLRDSPAWHEGLHVGDIILKVNNQPVDNDLNTLLSNFQVGQQIELEIQRLRSLKTEVVKLKLAKDPNKLYKLEIDQSATPSQVALRNAWLRKK